VAEQSVERRIGGRFVDHAGGPPSTGSAGLISASDREYDGRRHRPPVRGPPDGVGVGRSGV